MIDSYSRHDALKAMLDSHVSATRTVEAKLGEIDRSAEAVARALESGNMLYYAAAGSSALMALADACELPGTFGVSNSQIRLAMAGGVPLDGHMPGSTEDHVEEAKEAAKALKPQDVVILLSASGTTPYTCTFSKVAKMSGATVIAITNVPDSDLARSADISIALPTGSEVINGSTRLAAATAQKIVLNMISTQAGIIMGHVHDGQMVNLIPDNIKLRRRAADIVARIARVPLEKAEKTLEGAGFNTKLAVLVAAGVSMENARHLLSVYGGRLRDCLSQANVTK